MTRSIHSPIQLSTKTFGERDERFLTEGDRRAIAAQRPAERGLQVQPSTHAETAKEAYLRGRTEERADVVACIQGDAKNRCYINEQGIKQSLEILADFIQDGQHENSP